MFQYWSQWIGHLQIYEGFNAPMHTLYLKNITDILFGMVTKLTYVECSSLWRLPSTGMDGWCPASIFELLRSGMYGWCPASWGSKYAPGSMNIITSLTGLQVTAKMVLVLQILTSKREVRGSVKYIQNVKCTDKYVNTSKSFIPWEFNIWTD